MVSSSLRWSAEQSCMAVLKGKVTERGKETSEQGQIRAS